MVERVGAAPSVVTLGEALIRLFPDQGRTLEASDVWNVSVAGTEANVAIVLARLGIPACWISKLPRSPLGRKVASALLAAGVDVSRVVWTDAGRVGIYLTETGITPEDLHVWYDRGGSTFTTLEPSEIAWDILDRYSLMHFTGITPALGDRPLATVEAAVRHAEARGLQVSLDVNYRSRLWSPGRARETLLRLFQGRLHLLVCSRKDAREVFGLEGDEHAVRELRDQFGARVAVLTRGADGALAWDGRALLEARSYRGQIVDRIGRGDAFTAGLIAGYLSGNLELGLRQGCALAAMAQARWGDPLYATRDELDALLRAGPGDRR